MDFEDFPRTLLRGFSQVFLQKNQLTGLLFLAGIFFNSPLMGFGALLGCLSGTLTAVLFGFKKEDIRNGLYGFNGVLVGIALLFLFQINAATVILIVAGSAFSSLIMKFMHENKLFPFTFPFVLSTWILISAITFFGISGNNPPVVQPEFFSIVSSVGNGFGQVMFQGNLITGIIFSSALQLAPESIQHIL